jgi:hypothetical protein
MHEHPYLNGANDEVLKAGAVVTNEPVRLTHPLPFLRFNRLSFNKALTLPRESMSQTRKRRAKD